MIVPALHGELAGDDRRALAEAVLEEVIEITSTVIVESDHAPVVEDQDVDAGEASEQADVGAVGARERELIEEPRGAAVDRAEAVADRVLGEGWRQVPAWFGIY